MKIDWLLVVMYWGLFVACSNNSIISSFFPTYSQKFVDGGLSEVLIGLIFAVYSIGTLISSFWIGAIMGKKGRKKLFVVLGLATMAFGSLLFIILLWTPNIWAYTIISCIARFVIGFGEGMFMSPAFSLIPLIYKDTFEEKIGVMEAIAGFGLSSGPVFGGILY